MTDKVLDEKLKDMLSDAEKMAERMMEGFKQREPLRVTFGRIKKENRIKREMETEL